jgi:hypothetical protein
MKYKNKNFEINNFFVPFSSHIYWVINGINKCMCMEKLMLLEILKILIKIIFFEKQIS